MDTKTLIAGVLNHLGILDTYALLRETLVGLNIAILLYHRVSPDQEGPPEAVSPETFERQMRYFSRNYHVLPLDALVGHAQLREDVRKRAVVVTFDDGYKDNYVYAHPILKRYDIPATVFLATGNIGGDSLFWWDKLGYAIHNTSIGRLDLGGLGSYSLESQRDRCIASTAITERLKKLSGERRTLVIDKVLDICRLEIPCGLGRKLYLSWDDVRRMDSLGTVFGAHSVSHLDLTSISLERARDEVVRSKSDIEQQLGKEVTAFSYPFGSYNPEVLKLVRQSAFKCAVSAPPLGYKLASVNDDIYCLQRIPAVEDSNKMKGMLCGLVGDLHECVRLVHGPRRIVVSGSIEF